MASPPTKKKAASPNQNRNGMPSKGPKAIAKGSKPPVKKAGIKTTISVATSALKVYFFKINGYEFTAMVLFSCVLMVLIFARPPSSMLPTVLRLLALITTMAAKFLSNAGLSANPGSQADQATAKKLSLLVDGVAVALTAVSFFVH